MTSRARSDDTLTDTNQASASIDIRGHSEREISFGIRKSCEKISIDFGRNNNDGIGVNPSRTIGSISPQITSMKSGTERGRIGFRWNIYDGIPPRNTGSSVLFDRGI